MFYMTVASLNDRLVSPCLLTVQNYSKPRVYRIQVDQQFSSGISDIICKENKMYEIKDLFLVLHVFRPGKIASVPPDYQPASFPNPFRSSVIR
jgi:hypothetical protein